MNLDYFILILIVIIAILIYFKINKNKDTFTNNDASINTHIKNISDIVQHIKDNKDSIKYSGNMTVNNNITSYMTNLLPTGTIIPYINTTNIPFGWVTCNGFYYRKMEYIFKNGYINTISNKIHATNEIHYDINSDFTKNYNELITKNIKNNLIAKNKSDIDNVEEWIFVPDMTDRFLISYSDNIQFNTSGGSNLINIKNIPPHTHYGTHQTYYLKGSSFDGAGGGHDVVNYANSKADITKTNKEDSYIGNIANKYYDNKVYYPPYVVLQYILKL